MKTSSLCAGLLLGIAAWPAPGVESASTAPDRATANGLHRCIGNDGVTTFTDRRCEDNQATEDERPAGSVPAAGSFRVRSCARSQDDFLFGVRSALESGDVNRLAEYYHWTGMGTAAGYRLMDRLGVFSARPLVDVQLVSSRGQEDVASDSAADPGAADADRPDDMTGLDPEAARDSVTPSPPRPPRAPDLLRVDQTLSSDDPAAQVTYFRLRSNAGCWWMQF